MLRNYSKYIYSFFSRLNKKVIASIAIAFLFFSFFQTEGVLAADALCSSKVQCEEKIAELQKQIEGYKVDINQKEGERKTITKEVNLLTSKINALKLEINSTEIEIEKIGYDIKSTEEKISANEQNLAKQKEFLKELIRSIYMSQDKTFVEVLLDYNQLSDSLSEFQRLEKINNNVESTIEGIKTAKQELEKNKGDLLNTQEEKNNLLALAEYQKQDVQINQSQKQKILNLTVKEQKALQSELSKGEKLLPAMIAQLRNLQIGGQVISFEAALSAAKFAAGATGVRAALILGFLQAETNLGTNLGSGFYKTDMKPGIQQTTFLQITNELGLDPEKTPVSKRVCYDKTAKDGCGGWGGAMGPAQFMPTTWIGYKKGISAITGNNPPNPWNITDAVVAMSLFVSKTPGVVNHLYSAEYSAAKRYLGSCAGNYCTKVMDYAASYENGLATGQLSLK